MALVKVSGLSKYFRQGLLARHLLKAVDDVSFQIEEGETFGLVGESGCGKTTLGKMLARALQPSHGQVLFNDIDLFGVNGRIFRAIRPKIQMVFQDSDSALNPRMKMGDSILEPLHLQKLGTKIERKRRVLELLELVSLQREHLDRYPGELSGGELQRAVLARVLAVEPSFMVLDEPTSSLDVSVQAQILCLLKDLQQRFGLTYLFISHDLEVVSSMSRQVAVMYLGKFMEVGEADIILREPAHPYTKLLLSAVRLDRSVLNGHHTEPIAVQQADPGAQSRGCPFAPGCGETLPQCNSLAPNLHMVGHGHWVACYRL
jgi:oligopeptide/dipeptide ABC transporter ATP-binding protein